MKRTIITLTCLVLTVISFAQNETETCFLELINSNLRKNKTEIVFYDSLYHVTKNHNNSMIVFPESVISYKRFKISNTSNDEFGCNDTIKQTFFEERFGNFCPGFEITTGSIIYENYNDATTDCLFMYDEILNDKRYVEVLSDKKFNNIVFSITKHTFTRKHYIFSNNDSICVLYLSMFVF